MPSSSARLVWAVVGFVIVSPVAAAVGRVTLKGLCGFGTWLCFFRTAGYILLLLLVCVARGMADGLHGNAGVKQVLAGSGRRRFMSTVFW